MAALTSRDGTFVRPSPAGRHLGGVARATRESMLVLEAAGFDVVVVETVGVGQNEIAVSEMVDTFLLLTLRLMMPGKDTRRPPVLTCSAQTGVGLDEVWCAVLEHRAHLEAEGSLEVRRARQQQDWMWSMVDAHLHDAVRQSASVRERQSAIEHAVRSGSLSAVDGSAQVLDLFADDLRHG